MEPDTLDTRPVGSFATPDAKRGEWVEEGGRGGGKRLGYLGRMLHQGYICCLVKPRLRLSCLALGLVRADDMTPVMCLDELPRPLGHEVREGGRPASGLVAWEMK